MRSGSVGARDPTETRVALPPEPAPDLQRPRRPAWLSFLVVIVLVACSILSALDAILSAQ